MKYHVYYYVKHCMKTGSEAKEVQGSEAKGLQGEVMYYNRPRDCVWLASCNIMHSTLQYFNLYVLE